MACCVANVLNCVGNSLQMPSQWLLGATEPPILTTKYIFASYYKSHNEQSAALLKRVKEIDCQNTYQLAMRVIWAVSIILPVLDLFGAIFKEIAAFDSEIYKQNTLRDERQKLNLKAQQATALGHSVREFAVLLTTIGCKKEQDAGLDIDLVTQKRQETLRNFTSHFTDRAALNRAIGQVSSKILTFLIKPTGQTRQIQELIQPDATNESLLANIRYCFQKLKRAVENNQAPEYLMGEINGPFHREWSYLICNKDRLFTLCDQEGRII